MIVNAGFARGALKKLAELQATELDDRRDAEPGKIPHEVRTGELAHFHLIPHTPYYGTADATPLYLIVPHEAWKWLGDEALLREHRETALRCLEWIDRYGDLDGDGFQEYRTRSAQGYENMGWKDAGDAVIYPDGSQVRQPKALCELQGYVFDAWMRMAEIFEALGERERTAGLRAKASALRAAFEEKFWGEAPGFYAFALDSEKRPVPTIASNCGPLPVERHREPGPRRARRAAVLRARHVERMGHPDAVGAESRVQSLLLPAGIGLAARQRHHRARLQALWLRRRGGAGGAGYLGGGELLRELPVAGALRGYRAPPRHVSRPLSAGQRAQAWAAGSVFHLLQAMLGIRADAPGGRLYVDPELPLWLPEITLHGLAVGRARVGLRFWRDGDGSRWTAEIREGTISVQEEAWRPWCLD